MPAPTGALVYKNAVLTIEAVAYANQVRVARLVPDQPIQSYRTLVPDGVVQDVDSAIWTLELTGLQINSAGGLAKALRDAAGTLIDIVLQPQVGTGQATATFEVYAIHPPFGGEQGSYLEIEMELPVQGQPVFGTAA